MALRVPFERIGFSFVRATVSTDGSSYPVWAYMMAVFLKAG